MASEIRVNRLSNRSGLSTITFANGGVQFSGITTFANGDFRVGTGATIMNPSSNEMQFHTGGSNRLTINNEGINLGIGSITVGDATFTGSVSIGKTLTYEDVKNVDSIGVVTARTGVKVTGGDFTVGTAITASSVTGNVTNDVGITTYSGSAVWFKGATANKDMYWSHASGATVYKDNAQILMGDSSDLQISHDGTNSTILNTTGELIVRDDSRVRIRTDQLVINSGDNSESIIYAAKDGAVELYHNGTKKFETLNTGAKVTGDITISDKIIHDGDTNTAIRFPAADTITAETGGLERLRIDSSGRLQIGASNNTGANTKLVVGAGNNINTTAIINTGDVDVDALTLSNWDGSTTTNKVTIHFDSSGIGGWNIGMPAATDAFVFEDDGGTEKLRITATGEVNIGESSTQTSVKLHVDSGTTNNATVCTLKNDSTSAYATNDGGINTPLSLFSDGTNAAQSVGIQFYLQKSGETGCISEIGATRESSGNSTLVFRTRDSSTGRNERMRITSGGCVYANNFGIGTDNRWKIRGNTSNTDLAFEYSTSSTLSDSNIKAYFQGSSTDARLILSKTETGSCGLEFRNVGSQKAYQMLDSEENMVYLAQSGVHHRFYVGGSVESFRLDSGGQVQITGGGTTPLKVTHTGGDCAQFHRGSKYLGINADWGGNTGDSVITASTNLVVHTNGSNERLRIDSSGYVRLPDDGMLRFGAAPDLSLYHDHANQVNVITANTNLPIKIQGNVHFYNYAASGGFHAKLDGDGLALQNATRPTLPTTGVQPMIHGYATHFYREIHRTISDYRGLCDGTHSGYLLLIPAYGGSGTTAGKKFYGTIMADRGGTGSGNSTNVAYVHATTAYNTDRFNVSKERNTQYFTNPAKVTYSGTDYLALKFGATGGGPDHGIHIDGTYRNVDANFCRIVRTNEVTVVDDNYGSMNNMPASDALLCGFSQRHMSGAGWDNGVLKGGVTVFEHGDCYDANSGVFTAKFNGIYQFGCGILVQTGTGRLEGAIKINDGNGYDVLCNFNGTGTTYDGPAAIMMTVMRAGWTARVERLSGNAYDPTHGNNYFWGWMVQAMNKANVPATFP